MNNDEEKRGYLEACFAMANDGNTLEAAKHHLKVSNGDLEPDAFTIGWQRACRTTIAALTPQQETK